MGAVPQPSWVKQSQKSGGKETLPHIVKPNVGIKLLSKRSRLTFE